MQHKSGERETGEGEGTDASMLLKTNNQQRAASFVFFRIKSERTLMHGPGTGCFAALIYPGARAQHSGVPGRG